MKKIWLLTTLLTAWLLLTWCGSNMPEVCDRYFDWCNRCTRNANGSITCTKNECDTYQNPHCDESSYNEKYYQKEEEINRIIENDPELQETSKYLPKPAKEESDVDNELSGANESWETEIITGENMKDDIGEYDKILNEILD